MIGERGGKRDRANHDFILPRGRGDPMGACRPAPAAASHNAAPAGYGCCIIRLHPPRMEKRAKNEKKGLARFDSCANPLFFLRAEPNYRWRTHCRHPLATRPPLPTDAAANRRRSQPPLLCFCT